MEYHIYKCTDEDIFEVGKVYDTVTEYLENHVNYPKWVHGDYPSLKSAQTALENGSLYAVKNEGEIVCAFVLNVHCTFGSLSNKTLRCPFCERT